MRGESLRVGNADRDRADRKVGNKRQASPETGDAPSSVLGLPSS